MEKTSIDQVSTNERSLTDLMDFYGSDKGIQHGYTLFYESILEHKRQSIKCVLEIGIGTTDTMIPSNMGTGGKPGASLRAWSNFARNAKVIGADVDKKILFSEDRIETIYLDQLNRSSFADLKNVVSDGVDLLVIDGLHTPRADFNSLLELLPFVRKGGDCFIEDVGNLAIRLIWPFLLRLLGAAYEIEYFSRPRGNLIHISRVE